MKRTLYIDAAAGISGDMTVGALLDLGADAELLNEAIDSLGVSGFKIKCSKLLKGDKECTDFDVILDEKYDNHDHDMDYLYGHLKNGDYEVLTDLKEEEPHLHNHEHTHKHEHTHTHSHDHVSERSLGDVIEIIDSCKISEGAKSIAKDTFTLLAKAEAKVHGKSIENVHFHEVGAPDSIADIVAAAVCFDSLDIDEVIVPSLTDGHGSVRCRHGIIPVPVPAVNEIALDNNILLEISDIEGEMVTPTGAALVAAVRTGSELPEHFKITGSGYGAGKRNYDTRGYLAMHIIEAC